jgi:CubicO group peptidase (beta-lactamase class C family)
MPNAGGCEGLLSELLLLDDPQRFCLGAQASFLVAGRELHVVVGETEPGIPMADSTLHNLWCCSRPVIASALLQHCERAGHEVSAPIGGLGWPWAETALTGRSLLDLLAHDTALVRPTLLEAQLLPAGSLDQAALAAAQDQSLAEPGDVGLSDFTLWRLAVMWIRSEAGIELGELIERDVIEPLGLRDEVVFSMETDRLRALRPRIGPQLVKQVPELQIAFHDRSEEIALSDRASFGAYATMRGLTRFMAAIARSVAHDVDLSGLPTAGTLRSALGHRRPRAFDQKLGRVCSFAMGCMVGLEDHGFAGLSSPVAFGNAGWQGTSFVAADPDRQLTFGLAVNGLMQDEERSFALRAGMTELAQMVAAQDELT